MPWVSALIGAGAGLIGDVMSSSGQQQTNQMQMQMQQQSEQWQQQMRDTAMQSRVADLKAAGLNPMLATGIGGSSMVSPVMPNLQNPNAAFGSLGGQVSNAMQLQTQQAQIDLMKAQAGKANAETTQEIPAQVERIQSEIGLNNAQAQQVSKNVQMLDIQLSGGYFERQQQLGVAQNEIKTHLLQADQQERQDTLLTLIKARNDANFAASIGARNIANANDTEFGRIMAFFHLGQPVVSTAVGAARTLGEFVP